MKKPITSFLFILIFFCNANAQKSLIDSSYGENGTSFFNLPGSIVRYSKFVKELKDNRTLIVYQTQSLTSPDTLNILFADDKGNIIPDGDGDARVLALSLADYGLNNTILAAINQQHDGKILITGKGRYSLTLSYLFVLRCMPDGSVDKSFGENGMAKQPFYANKINEEGFYLLMANSVETDSKNRIVVSVHYLCQNCGGDTLTLLRFLPDGKIDSAFGTDGIARVYSGMGSYGGYINQLVILPDDKILTCGDDGLRDDQDPANKNKFVVIRFNTNGTVDSSFGVNGRSFNYYNIRYDNVPYYIHLDRNNKIVVGGNYTINPFRYYENLGLVRLNADGSPDNEFAAGSRLIIDYPGYSLHGTQNLGDNLGDMEVQENGKILFGATLTDIKLDPTIWDGIVYRFNDDGSPDMEFADSGIYRYSFAGAFDNVDTKDSLNQMELKRDGDILLYGSFSSINETTGINFYSNYITRLNGDYVPVPIAARIRRWIRNHILHFEETNPLSGTAYYSIEQKENGIYKQVAKLQPRKDAMYSYQLPETNTVNTYRISSVQKNGSVGASCLVTDNVSISPDNTKINLHIWPNPVKNNLNIEAGFIIKEISITGMQGHRVGGSTIKGLKTQTIFTAALKPGIYNIEIIGENGEKETARFVKE